MRVRLGLTLILAIVFADAATVAAKAAFESPRPHAVDARVQTLGAIESRLPLVAATASVPADDFGFPSGHVAVTTALALGLAWSHRKPWAFALAAIWIAAMALSRMYLGRHFPADVLGGVVVGAGALAVARFELPPRVGVSGRRAAAQQTLVIPLAAAFAVVLGALAGAGLGSHDTGRFCGLVGAIVVLVRMGSLDESAEPATRAARLALALILLGVALWSSTWTVAGGSPRGVLVAVAISAALHASVLLVPALGVGRRRP